MNQEEITNNKIFSMYVRVLESLFSNIYKIKKLTYEKVDGETKIEITLSESCQLI